MNSSLARYLFDCFRRNAILTNDEVDGSLESQTRPTSIRHLLCRLQPMFTVCDGGICVFRAAVRWPLRSRNRTGWPEKFKTLYIATASSLPPPAKKHALSWQKPIRHHPLSPLNQPLTTDSTGALKRRVPGALSVPVPATSRQPGCNVSLGHDPVHGASIAARGRTA